MARQPKSIKAFQNDKNIRKAMFFATGYTKNTIQKGAQGYKKGDEKREDAFPHLLAYFPWKNTRDYNLALLICMIWSYALTIPNFSNKVISLLKKESKMTNGGLFQAMVGLNNGELLEIGENTKALGKDIYKSSINKKVNASKIANRLNSQEFKQVLNCVFGGYNESGYVEDESRRLTPEQAVEKVQNGLVEQSKKMTKWKTNAVDVLRAILFTYDKLGIDFNGSGEPQSAPVPTPAVAKHAPVSNPSPVPAPRPTPTSETKPKHAPVSNPSPVPAPRPTPTSETTPVSMPTSETTPVSMPTSETTPVSMPTSETKPVSKPMPNPAPGPTPTSETKPVSKPMPNPAPGPTPTFKIKPVSTPTSNPLPAPAPKPEPKPAPNPRSDEVVLPPPTPKHDDESAKSDWVMFFDNTNYIYRSGDGVRRKKVTFKEFLFDGAGNALLRTLVEGDRYCFVGYKKISDKEHKLLILPTAYNIMNGREVSGRQRLWEHTDEDIEKIKRKLLRSKSIDIREEELISVGIDSSNADSSKITIYDYIKKLNTCLVNDQSKKRKNEVKANPEKIRQAYSKFMEAGSAEKFMEVFDSVFNDKTISSMEDLMSYSEALLKSVYDQSVKHDIDPYNARIYLKQFNRELKYVHGEFFVSDYVSMFKADVLKYIQNIFETSDDKGDEADKATLEPMDEKIRGRVLKKYYGKTIKLGEELTLYFNGEERVWIPVGDETSTKTGLKPLTTEEKLQLALGGARGDERQAIKDKIVDWMPKGYKYDTDEKLIEDLLRLSDEKIRSALENIENSYIFNGRPYKMKPETVEMDAGDHGIAHATRLVSYIDVIARFIKKHQGLLKLKPPTKDEIILAKYAALFHDSGRANKIVDVFDETSAHIAGEELKDKLSSANIKRVQGAIKNKDAYVEGKDIVAIMLHEADSFDVIRVHGARCFDYRYLDVVQSYFGKHQGDISDEELNKLDGDIAKSLDELKLYCIRYINKLRTLKKSEILDDDD